MRSWRPIFLLLAVAGCAEQAGAGPFGIHDIQGTAHVSPLAGSAVSDVPGIVTALRHNGFFFQDPEPDGRDATSEGLFVFTDQPPDVLVGDLVRVSGRVTEFRPGCFDCPPSNAAFANLTLTQIERPTALEVVASGRALPPPVELGAVPAGRQPPTAVIDDDSRGDVEAPSATFDPESDGLDFFESLEGMRLAIRDPVAVGPTFEPTARAREIPVLAAGGSGTGPRTPRGGIVVAAGDFNPERLILANALSASAPLPAPSVDVGDLFPGVVLGVLDYGFGNFKLLLTEPLPAPVASGLDRESLTFPPPLDDQLTVATLNLENLDSREPAARFAELAAIVVDRLRSPDLVALEEVQDNNGSVNDAVVDASATLQKLAAAIAAAGGPSYAFRGIDPLDDQDGGEPGGNIRTVMMFRADRGLAFVDRPGAGATTANEVMLGPAGPQLRFSPGRLEPGNTAAFAQSRKPLAAELSFIGQTIFVVVNHFNAKGGDQPLYGRFQPPGLGSEAQRGRQAAVVAAFVRTLLEMDPGARVVVMGDLNDHPFSAPLERLEAAGLVNLVESLPPGERYTYVFEGNSQALDHILVSRSLADSPFDIVHVNAEFAQQASDHDPCAARFSLRARP